MTRCGTWDTQTVGLQGELDDPVCTQSVQVAVVHGILRQRVGGGV